MRTFASLMLVLGLAACKQGVGEICQTNSDCASNVCSHVAGQTYQHCVEATGGDDDDDGQSTIDANPIDGTPIDATVDAPAAPIDATIDAP